MLFLLLACNMEGILTYSCVYENPKFVVYLFIKIELMIERMYVFNKVYNLYLSHSRIHAALFTISHLK